MIADLLEGLGGAGAVVGFIKLVVGIFDKRTDQALAAKDKTIAVQETQLAELRGALERLGAKHDALAAQYQRVCVKAAVAARDLEEPYRDAMPTAVRDILADLPPAPATPPRGTPAPRPRLPTIRESYAPNARPTKPAPAGPPPLPAAAKSRGRT